ncbi:vWFA domain containing protein [uncultured Caudovirales phage]|uniref:VWFA domain containing protein n=1 Tax=uncultured Caudovirales phage TaxID=2100421 RepID=A0A6J5LJL9_9CAUD|nr:vWFA domain containing protein [uncultured Caudovirales phage]CAB4134798.1 vWFA domain containing protein [uncultured Caudovirales phage]
MATRKPKTTNEQQLEDRITKARASIIMDSVFFGSLMVRLQPKLNNDIPTMATEGKYIHYNANFTDGLNDAELKGVIVHEVMHCAMAHHARRGERSARGWNMACDYAINPLVKESGFMLPKNCLENPAYAGMAAEEIYALFPDGDGDSGGDGMGSDHWNVGGVEPGAGDGDSSSKSDLEQEQQNWKNAVAEAAMTARMMGKMPAGLDRFVEELMDATLPWQELLARFIHNVAKNDFNWSRPNKGLLQNFGIYMPTLHSDACGTVALIVDTSGSIGQRELTEFGAELNGILDMVRPERVHVIYCDAAVAHVEEFTPDQYPVRLEAHGGGGTDFRPAFEYIDENLSDVQCAIYLTDMYGTFPDSEPDYPTMWVSNSTVSDAPFGQVIQLSR